MKIVKPVPVLDNVELTKDDVREAINLWLQTKHSRSLEGDIVATLATAKDFRITGQLAHPPVALPV